VVFAKMLCRRHQIKRMVRAIVLLTLSQSVIAAFPGLETVPGQLSRRHIAHSPPRLKASAPARCAHWTLYLTRSFGHAEGQLPERLRSDAFCLPHCAYFPLE